jgi:hypothetical protein
MGNLLEVAFESVAKSLSKRNIMAKRKYDLNKAEESAVNGGGNDEATKANRYKNQSGGQ